MESDMLDLLLWLAWRRDDPWSELDRPIYQEVISHICREFGYSQESIPLEATCLKCGGGQTIGDRLCPKCGGAGHDLAPILIPHYPEPDPDKDEDDFASAWPQ